MGNKPTTQIALLQLLILTHVVEEYFFGFPTWATLYFGTTTNAWYVLSHLLLAPMFIAILVATYKALRWGIFFAVALQVLIFANGLFHISAFAVWGEYSPGSLSQIVIIPLTFIVYYLVFRHRLLKVSETIISSLVGIIVCAFVVASLLLDVPI